MLTLALIGLLGGLITGVSPCVLPMLPILFVAGTTGRKPVPSGSPGVSGSPGGPGGVAVAERTRGRRDLRPLKIIAGVVVSFSVFTLLGSAVLSALGLPDDLLRWIGLVVLVLVGLGLIVPALGHLIERPFYRLPKLTTHDHGAFVLGLGLGTLYVPCAGPVLAAITVAGATGNVGWRTVVLTVSFALGAALPLLVFASAGSRVAHRVRAYRSRARVFRTVAGVVLIGLSVALAFDASDALQRALPNYTGGLERKLAESDTAQGALAPLAGDDNKELDKCTPGAVELSTCGKAPAIRGAQRWFNTRDNKPLSLDDLRGKVVLVDFWAYSCINCQRATPHLKAWYDAYHGKGLEIVGIHSPEFAFEKDAGNLSRAIRKERIRYPVAQDNNLGTWTAYRNRYWPAKYLIDAEGNVRAIRFGEGGYDSTEQQIRDLLTEAGAKDLPEPVDGTVQAARPGVQGTTPETYLSYSRASNYRGVPRLSPGKTWWFRLTENQPDDTFSLGGTWSTGTQYVTSTSNGSRSRLNFNAAKVYHVLSGEGTVTVSIPGEPYRVVTVSGNPDAYLLVDRTSARRSTMTLKYSAGLTAYTFSFG